LVGPLPILHLTFVFFLPAGFLPVARWYLNGFQRSIGLYNILLNIIYQNLPLRFFLAFLSGHKNYSCGSRLSVQQTIKLLSEIESLLQLREVLFLRHPIHAIRPPFLTIPRSRHQLNNFRIFIIFDWLDRTYCISG